MLPMAVQQGAKWAVSPRACLHANCELPSPVL
jgi:hypothetical protein